MCTSIRNSKVLRDKMPKEGNLWSPCEGGEEDGRTTAHILWQRERKNKRKEKETQQQIPLYGTYTLYLLQLVASLHFFSSPKMSIIVSRGGRGGSSNSYFIQMENFVAVLNFLSTLDETFHPIGFLPQDRLLYPIKTQLQKRSLEILH